MANFNRVILAGNLTRDPELSYTTSGTAVCKFGLAVNRKWTNRQTNEKNEETMFIDCVAWTKSGEVINQYCRKGKPLLIEGRLGYSTWTTQEGQKRSKHEVVVDNFQFLDSGGGGRPPSGGDMAASRPPEHASSPPSPDDVPF